MDEKFKILIIQVGNLFTKYGIKSMTMDEIAREMGMSKKTLYQYVKNKDELVQHVIEHLYNENKKNFDSLIEKKLNAIEFLIYVNKVVHQMMRHINLSFEFDLKKYHPEIYRNITIQNKSEMYNMVKGNMIQGKKEGLYRDNLNEIIIAKLYVDRIEAVRESDLITEDEKMHPEFINQIMEYHIRGIANEKGIKLYNQIKNQINED